MQFQIILNLVLAFVWMLLQDTWSLTVFISGYGIGLFIIFFMRRFLPEKFYVHTIWAIIKLIILFIKELVLSNYIIAKFVVDPKLNFRPGIFALPTALEKNWQITLLANLITLTPGTLTIEVAADNDVLYIHAMDLPNIEEAILKIKNTFEKAIMEVSR